MSLNPFIWQIHASTDLGASECHFYSSISLLEEFRFHCWWSRRHWQISNRLTWENTRNLQNLWEPFLWELNMRYKSAYTIDLFISSDTIYNLCFLHRRSGSIQLHGPQWFLWFLNLSTDDFQMFFWLWLWVWDPNSYMQAPR